MPGEKIKASWRLVVPILLALFFLSLLPSQPRRAPWYEQWAWNAISPFVGGLFWFKTHLGDFGSHYLYLVGVAKQNEALRTQVAHLEQRLVTLREMRQENKRLTRLLRLREERWPEGIAARVTAFDPRSEFRTIRIDKGAADGIRPLLPVIAAGGLVGKVGPVFERDAQVLLIVDASSFVDVAVARTDQRCLLRGSGLLKHAQLRHKFFLTRLEYVKKESDVRIGDAVVTTGLDGLYPSGIMVGTLRAVTRDPYGLFLKADILPAVDFSKLREVLVLVKE